MLTTRAVIATTGPTTTFAYGNPNYLGVDSGGDSYGGQFESAFSEAWVFNFSKDVTPYIALNISPNASLYIAINIT